MAHKASPFLFGFAATLLASGCAKHEQNPTVTAEALGASEPAAIPAVAPPQAVSLADAKRVFAAHDCCGRYINTDFYRVGAIQVKNRVFTVFQMTFSNPDSGHGMQHIAILDGLKLLGTYQVDGANLRLNGNRIVFDCAFDERQRNPKLCDEALFQDLDLSQTQLPKTIIVYGQKVVLGNSI